MGIREDAGKILLFFYEEYMNDNTWIDTKKTIETTQWESGRINRSIDYLRDLDAIKVNLYMGNTDGVYNFGIRGLTPTGIHMIEEKAEFQRNFGFKIGIPGTFEFNWSATER